MRINIVIATVMWLSLGPVAWAVGPPKKMEARGEVVDMDPIFHRLTIRHGTIAGFTGAGETDFTLYSDEKIRQIRKRDVVDFSFTNQQGFPEITDIQKRGSEPGPTDDKVLIASHLVGDFLKDTDETAKENVKRSPPPARMVAGAIASTAEATGNAVKGITDIYKKEKDLTSHNW